MLKRILVGTAAFLFFARGTLTNNAAFAHPTCICREGDMLATVVFGARNPDFADAHPGYGLLDCCQMIESRKYRPLFGNPVLFHDVIEAGLNLGLHLSHCRNES